MSYSRRELGFVDDLVSKLEEKKYDVWLFGLLIFGIVQFDNYIYSIFLEDAGIDAGFIFTCFGAIIYLLGVALLAIVYFRNRLDMKRWFPATKK
jgi:hypothetical protein